MARTGRDMRYEWKLRRDFSENVLETQAELIGNLYEKNHVDIQLARILFYVTHIKSPRDHEATAGTSRGMGSSAHWKQALI